MSRDSRINFSLRRGFTLLELIIVLVVLAALAALVVPTLGFVRDQADYSTAAAGAAEVLNNLEIYKASTGRYPNRMDTLVDSGGSFYAQAYGFDSSGEFAFGSVQPGVGYFFTNGGGPTEVMMHDPAETDDPNNSTLTQSPTPVSSASFAVIDPASANSYYLAKLRRIVRAAYPNQSGGTSDDVAIPEGHTLIALGVGPRSSCVGSTMTTAPIHGGAEDGTYSHYIALFDVSAGGTGRGQVQLKLVTDSTFEVIAKNLSNYGAAGPQDDEAIYEEPEDTGSGT